MPKSINQQDIDNLRDVFLGEMPLRVGITNRIHDPYRRLSSDPSIVKEYYPDAFENFEALQHHARAMQERISHENSLGGDRQLGFLTVPEFFLAHNINPGTEKYNQKTPADRRYFKEQLRQLSEECPDLILNPVGLYEKEVDKSNPEKVAKFQDKMQKFGDELRWQFLLDKGRRINTDNYPEVEEYLKGFSNLSDAERNKVVMGEASYPPDKAAAPWHQIKNKSDFYFKGNKIANYKKSSYSNEITNNLLNKNQLGYTFGDFKMKDYGDGSTPESQYSKLFANKVFQKICHDKNVFPPEDPRSTISLLNSENVPIRRSYTSPLSIYSDNSGLLPYSLLGAPHFMGLDPDSMEKANLFKDERTGAMHPYVSGPLSSIPDSTYGPPFFTSPSGEIERNPSLKPWYWPVVTYNNGTHTPVPMVPFGQRNASDPTTQYNNPGFYSADNLESDTFENLHKNKKYATHQLLEFQPTKIPYPLPPAIPPTIPPYPTQLGGPGLMESLKGLGKSLIGGWW